MSGSHINAGYLDQVPQEDVARVQWLAERTCARDRAACRPVPRLDYRTYGTERGERVRLIEAFEVSEYGAPLDAEARTRLFPFLPAGFGGGLAVYAKDVGRHSRRKDKTVGTRKLGRGARPQRHRRLAAINPPLL